MDSKHKKTSQFSNTFKLKQISGLDNSGIVGSRIQPTVSEISSKPTDQFEGSFYIQTKKGRDNSIIGKPREMALTEDPLIAL